MKRLLILILTFVTLAMFMPAARANTTHENCNIYENDGGGKRVKICVSVGFATNSWWAHIEFRKVPGYMLPYGTDGTSLTQGCSPSPCGIVLWSKSKSGGGYCLGQAPGCVGNGDGDWSIRDMNAMDAPYNVNSLHYGNSEHYCLVHANGIGSVIWSQNQTPQWFNFNSDSPDVDSSPDCRS